MMKILFAEVRMQLDRQGPAAVVMPVFMPKYSDGWLWINLWVFYLNNDRNYHVIVLYWKLISGLFSSPSS